MRLVRGSLLLLLLAACDDDLLDRGGSGADAGAPGKDADARIFADVPELDAEAGEADAEEADAEEADADEPDAEEHEDDGGCAPPPEDHQYWHPMTVSPPLQPGWWSAVWTGEELA